MLLARVIERDECGGIRVKKYVNPDLGGGIFDLSYAVAECRAQRDALLAACELLLGPGRGWCYVDAVFYCGYCEAETTNHTGTRDDLMDAEPIWDDPDHPHDEDCPHVLLKAAIAAAKGEGDA